MVPQGLGTLTLCANINQPTFWIIQEAHLNIQGPMMFTGFNNQLTHLLQFNVYQHIYYILS